jgi:hypothetical protein
MQSTGEQGIRIKSFKFLWQLPIYHPEQCAGTPAEKGAMGNSLFPTYTPGEHRVTTSMLAVLRSLALGRIERLLGALLEQSAFELVRCQHRPSRGAPGIPDAEIVSSCRLLRGTAGERTTVRHDQRMRHLHRLDHRTETIQGLLLFMPDEARPAVVDRLADQRLFWTSFAALAHAIDELPSDPKGVLGEREAFLLREPHRMLAEEGEEYKAFFLSPLQDPPNVWILEFASPARLPHRCRQHTALKSPLPVAAQAWGVVFPGIGGTAA